MKTYLEYKDPKSEKFWEVSVKGKVMTTRWGKLDTQGQSKSKELESSKLAKVEAEKQKALKIKKGYKEVTAKKKTAAKKKTPAKKKAAVKNKEPTKKNDTDSTSESLRKFLESDDPSLVLMGLSMAKGVGVEEELLPVVLARALFSEEEEVRRSGEAVFADHAPEELRNLPSALRAEKQAAERSLELAMIRYQEGYVSFQSVLDAQKAVARQTETELVNQGLLSALHGFAPEFWRKVLEDLADGQVPDIIKKSTVHAQGVAMLEACWAFGLVLAKDTNDSIRRRVARNRKTPAAVLEVIAKGRDLGVCWLVVRHPNTPLALLEMLAKDEGRGFRSDVAENPNTPVALLEMLAKDEDWRVRSAVADNPNTPLALLEMLAKDEDWRVRRDVVDNPNTSVALRMELLLVLANDKNERVRENVAENPNTPVALLEVLAKDKYKIPRGGVARNRKTPEALLEMLAKDEDEWVRRRVARNPNTPVASLETLAKDADEDVRANVAQNSDGPLALLEVLATDRNQWVRDEVAANTNSVALLEVLAKDKDGRVRRGVAANPNTPVALLEVLAKDKEQWVRENVAENPNTPAASLEILAKDKHEAVRLAVWLPNTPSYSRYLGDAKEQEQKQKASKVEKGYKEVTLEKYVRQDGAEPINEESVGERITSVIDAMVVDSSNRRFSAVEAALKDLGKVGTSNHLPELVGKLGAVKVTPGEKIPFPWILLHETIELMGGFDPLVDKMDAVELAQLIFLLLQMADQSEEINLFVGYPWFFVEGLWIEETTHDHSAWAIHNRYLTLLMSLGAEISDTLLEVLKKEMESESGKRGTCCFPGSVVMALIVCGGLPIWDFVYEVDDYNPYVSSESENKLLRAFENLLGNDIWVDKWSRGFYNNYFDELIEMGYGRKLSEDGTDYEEFDYEAHYS